MSVNLIRYKSPFSPQHETEVVEYRDWLTVGDLIKQYRHPSENVDMVVVVNGEKATNDKLIMDGDEVVIRAVPRGTTGTGDGSAKIAGWAVASFMLGIIFLAIPGTQMIGTSLILSGVAGFATAIGVAYTANHQQDQAGQSQSYSIRGSRNSLAQWGKVPIVLGKHLVVPPLAASGYTDISGTSGVNQYVNLLYVIGYGKLKVTNLKFGDQVIATNAADVRNGAIDCTTGNLSGFVSAEIRQDDSGGTNVTLFPSAIAEESVGAELDPAVTVRRVTGKHCTWISVDVCFARGLTTYNSEGAMSATGVEVIPEYRENGSAGAWTAMPYFSGGAHTIVSNTKELIRFTSAAVVAADEYEVRVRRVTALSTSNDVLDDVTWTTMRTKNGFDAVDINTRKKVVLVAVRVLASEGLNGIIDQFNCEAQTVTWSYDGSGTGIDNWTQAASVNPASAMVKLMLDSVNARPVESTMIDWAAMETFYAWCASKSFECNAVLGSGMKLADALRQIASTGRASFTLRDGLYSVIVDTTRTTVVQHITPRNSWGFTESKVFTEKPNALKIAFINAAEGWATDECIVCDDDYTESTAITFQKITLWGVTNYNQVWKLGRYLIACNKLRPETFQVNMDAEGLACTRGDLVKVAHDSILWGLAQGRITGTTIVGGEVTEIDVDNMCPMEAAKTYVVTIRLKTGATITEAIATEEGDQTTLAFSTPVAGATLPDVGDLFMFGETDVEAIDCIVTEIEMLEDLAVRLTLVEHAPGVFTADSGEIPAFDSKVSHPAQFSPPDSVSPNPPPVSVMTPPKFLTVSVKEDVTSPYDGLMVLETTTGRIYRYDGTSAEWVYEDAQNPPSDVKLLGAWGCDELPEFPDKVSGITSLERTWDSIGSWFANTNGPLTVSGGYLVLKGNQEYAYKYVNINGKIVRIKIIAIASDTFYLGYRTTPGGAYILTAASITLNAGETGILNYFGVEATDILFIGHGTVEANSPWANIKTIYIGTGDYTTVVPDDSGNGHHALGYYGPRPVASAIDFNGTNTHLVIGNIRHPTAFTYAAKVTLDAWPTDVGIIISRKSASWYLAVYVSGGVRYLRYSWIDSAGNQQVVMASAVDAYISLGDEHSIVTTHDGTYAKIYVDDTPRATSAASSLQAEASQSAADYLIGAYNTSGTMYPFDGRIREVRIYSIALSLPLVRGYCLIDKFTKTYNLTKWITEYHLPVVGPHYLGKFNGAHPTSRNPGDYWLVYDTDDTPYTRGIYYDLGGVATRLTTDLGEHATKIMTAMPDIIDVINNGTYGAAADYGTISFIPALASTVAFITSLFAEHVKIQAGGSIRGGDRYDEDGAIADGTKPGFFISASGGCKVAGIEFDGSQGGGVQWSGGQQVGTELNIAGVQNPSITALSGTEIAFIDGGNADLRFYRTDGTAWTMIGAELNIAGMFRPAICALNGTDIAFIDDGNDELRLYRWDGDSWSMVGSGLSVSGVTYPRLTALNATDVAFVDMGNGDLRTYRWDGDSWSMVGSELNIADSGAPAICTLNETDIAFIDAANEDLRTYRWDGDSWSMVGSELNIAGVGVTAICALNGTDIAFIDAIGDQLRVYRWNGTDWILLTVAGKTDITSAGTPALCALNGTDIVFLDSDNDDLRVYRYSYSLSKPWRYPFTS